MKLPGRFSLIASDASRWRISGKTALPARLLSNEICEQYGCPLSIDLTDITFLDSDSASVLCRLKRQGIILEGLDLFVRKVVELAEKSGSD